MDTKGRMDPGSPPANSPKGPPTDSLRQKMHRGDGPEAHQLASPRHRDGRPARAEGQHKAGSAKHLPGGPRPG